MVRIRTVNSKNPDDGKNEATELEKSEEEKKEQRIKRSLRARKPLRRMEITPDYSSKNRWTVEEKIKLLNGLKEYGYKFMKIAEDIPSRSPLEVLYCMKYWKRMACIDNIKSASRNKILAARQTKASKRKLSKAEEVKNEQLSNTEAWIDCFAKRLSKSRADNSDSEGIYALSHAFYVIAELEAHPHPDEADGLDFRELYLWLHNFLNGNPMKKLSPIMMHFIASTFNEIVNATNSTNMVSQMTYANHIAQRVNSKSISPSKIKTYQRPIKKDSYNGTQEYRSSMEELIQLPHLNPLKIQVDERLKKSVNLCKD